MISDVNNDVSQQKTRKPLLSEILRPQALSDLTLPMPTIERLQRVIESGSMVNMLFYGPPGSGKTGAAEIFMDAIGGCRTINRSSSRRANLAKYSRTLLHVAVPRFALLTRRTLFRNVTK
jgi:replication-associated recombination protein RarA